MHYALCAMRHFYPACPAIPVAPADGTGVAPVDRTGALEGAKKALTMTMK